MEIAAPIPISAATLMRSHNTRAGSFKQYYAHCLRGNFNAAQGRRVGMIEAAQARGDFLAFAERARRVLRAHIMRDVGAGLAAIGVPALQALQ